MSRPVFALIDCNRFYASCERVFQPELRGRPLVVLSNNDGCVVTLTDEAKALGIRRGTPAFKIADLLRSGACEWRSSNYELYASISRRVMGIIADMTPAVEVYSIDECFADLTGVEGSLDALGRAVRERILRCQRIPTCVGIAETKTLAKLANRLAKNVPALGGVLNWLDLPPARRERALAITPVADVWGVGGRTEEKLARLGVRTALDFARMDAAWVRRTFGVVLERTWRELNGTPCIPFDPERRPKREICRSRSFGRPVRDPEALAAAVSCHLDEAARQLRRQRSLAGELVVCMHTDFFRPDLPQHSAALAVPLPQPTADTLTLTLLAVALVREHRRPECAYRKAGVILRELVPEAKAGGPAVCDSLFDELTLGEDPRRGELMRTVDGLGRRFGRSVVRPASTRLASGWEMRRGHLSPCFTTRIDEVLKVDYVDVPEDAPAP